jgi:rSAM/selenodomain-associated transferase 2
LRSLSVIIPTLNEEDAIADVLSDLGSQTADVEVLVVDGGSSDRTVDVAHEGGAVVHSTQLRNRARQLNLGAEKAAHDWLLFLHADTRIPSSKTLEDALEMIQAHRGGAGHFSLVFKGPDETHLGFQYLSRKTRLNRLNTTNGDQGFMMHREVFERLGPFDDSQPFLEDQKLAERIREHAYWITLPGYLETSTRRFAKEGFAERYTLMAVMMGCHSTGIHQFFDVFQTYAPQCETQKLELQNILDAVYEVTGAMPLAERMHTWFKVGRYIRKNAWQIALALDVYVLEEPENQALEFFDKHVDHRIDAAFWDAVTALLSAAYFHVLVPLRIRRKSLR